MARALSRKKTPSLYGLKTRWLTVKMPLTLAGAAVLQSEFFFVCIVRSPAGFRNSTFSPPLITQDAHEPAHVCACQPVVSMISASVAPLARFIIAMTPAFLLLRSSVLPVRARAAAAEPWPGLLPLPSLVRRRAPVRALRGQTLDGRQIRATAAFRLGEFLSPAYNSVKGATREAVPDVDQPRARPLRAELANSFSSRNALHVFEVGGTAACAAMLFFESIVNVSICCSPCRYGAVVTFITPGSEKTASQICRAIMRRTSDWREWVLFL